MKFKFINRVFALMLGVALIGSISSCTEDDLWNEGEEDEFAFSTFGVEWEVKGGLVGVKDIVNGFYDFSEKGDGVVGFSILPAGDPVTSVSVFKSYNGSSPVLHEKITSFPANVSITLAQAIEGITSIDEVELGDVVTFSLADLETSSGAYPVAAQVSAEVKCTSVLGGLYNAVTTGGGVYGGSTPCSNVWEGQVEFIEGDGGVYDVFAYDAAHEKGVVEADMSMGAYWACYSPTTALPLGDLKIVDFCNTLSYTGTSQWGEVYTFSKVESSGSSLTIEWSNSYGEAGSTVLTTTDGSDFANYSF
jgi:hypothetical protein